MISVMLHFCYIADTLNLNEKIFYTVLRTTAIYKIFFQKEKYLRLSTTRRKNISDDEFRK